MIWTVTGLVFSLTSHLSLAAIKPNIVLVLADDVGESPLNIPTCHQSDDTDLSYLGINDVSWNNPRGSTPYLGRLAQSGIILDNAYSLPVCTPSRSALLTGVYPFRIGLQRGFGKHTPEGVPLNTTLLPQYMKEMGYSTHGLGKWHLGFCSESYTPLKRGFDSYYGLFVGDDEENIDQARPSSQAKINKKKKKKFKKKSSNRRKRFFPSNKKKKFFNRKKKLIEEDIPKADSGPSGKLDSNMYSEKAIEIIRSSRTDQPFFIYLALFTKSYPREVKKLRGKKIENHRVKKLREMDNSMRNILDALKESGHYENTVLIFISDNGGRELSNLADNENPNYPLRGSKGSVYEGSE